MAPKRLRNGTFKGDAPVTKSEVRTMLRSTIMSVVEVKRYSLAQAAAATVAAGTIYPLTQALIIGDTISTRTGDALIPKQLEFNCSFVANATTSSINRLIIFQDLINGGVTPVPADVLDGATYLSSFALYNSQQSRFKILYDKYHMVDSYSTTATNFKPVVMKLILKMKHKIFYNGDTNAATANGKGSLWALVISNNALANVAFYSSLLFTDP